MFQFRLKKFPQRSQARNDEEEKKLYLQRYQEARQLGRQLEATSRSEGYKAAVAHFEGVINNLIRSKEVNYDRLQGIEEVFTYFESGARMAEVAEDKLKEAETYDGN